MMDLTDINATIEELENQKVTFDSCQKLAMLYIVRDHNQEEKPVVAQQATAPLIPSYSAYCMDKRKYQLGQLTEIVVLDDLRFVCSDILLLVQRIYSGSDTEAEKEQIKSIIRELTTKYL